MLAALKRLLGLGTASEEPDAAATEPVIVEYRLAYRPLVDANGWTTVESWPAGELALDDDLPLTRAAFRELLGPTSRLGHYTLFPVDEHSRLRPAEWRLTHGTRARARRRAGQPDQQTEADADETAADATGLPPQVWADIQETLDDMENPFGGTGDSR